MELIIIAILILLTILFFRKFSNVVYIICIIDMFLRILYGVASVLSIKEFNIFVNKYFHSSILSIINGYSIGIINTILVCLYLFIYMVFLGYVIRAFFRKKK